MASLSSDKNGNRTIQFVGGDGKRRSIRLGGVTKKLAESVKLKVESLNAAAVARMPLDNETAAWTAGVGEDLHGKLAAVGLVPPRRSAALGAFLEEYLDRRRAESKPGTVVNIGQTARELVNFFGPLIPLRAVNEETAEGFKAHLHTRTLAAATVCRRLKNARMLFEHARKMKLIPTNPFADVKSKNVNPTNRRQYVPADHARKLIEVADPTWRTVVALARFAGLRTPSETLLLRWEHVDFPNGRMTVDSPKTEHHEGRAFRVVPIFPDLRPHLEEAFELAADGDVYVIGGKTGDGYRAAARRPDGWNSCNMRTTFLKLIRRAGLTPWPKLFHNLRASCETDLMQEHPIHVVTAWIGNTPKIALGHYLQTLEGDFEKAIRGGAKSGAVVVQNAVQSGTDGSGPGRTEARELLEIQVKSPELAVPVVNRLKGGMGDTGFEPVTSTV